MANASPRVIALIGAMMLGAIVGFFAVQSLAPSVLSASQGPSPYSDWRPVAWGLMLGIPLGAVAGLTAGVLLTRNSNAGQTGPFFWRRVTGLGIAVGLTTGLVFIGSPILELFEHIGKLLSAPWIGRTLYFGVCGAMGGAILTLGVMIVRNFRHPGGGSNG